MRYYDPKRRDNPGDFFPMPKAVFRLGLDYGEIALLAFLMYCEDRKTSPAIRATLPSGVHWA